MGSKLVASIDCGTTSSRVIVFDGSGQIVVQAQQSYEQLYPKPGWHEQSPTSLYNSVKSCLDKTARELQGLGMSTQDVACIGITNQRETAVVWSRKTGEPVCNAIVWDDNRTEGIVTKYAQRSPLGTNGLRDRTALPMTTYFSAFKLLWMLENVEGLRAAYEREEIQFGTVESWLLYRLTGGTDGGKHLTDPTNACRTLFMNIHTQQWDQSLLDFFGVKSSILPKIVPSVSDMGSIVEGPWAGIPITAMLGDQQAALLGHQGLSAGAVKATYGTGCFILMHTGDKLVQSENGLLPTIACQLEGERPSFALEGSVAVAGTAINWLRDNLQIINESKEVSDLASSVSDNGGVYFVTAFSGLFAPYWDAHATGTLIGLTNYTSKYHIARATLESIAFQTKALVDVMREEAGQRSQKVLRVDGGVMASDVMCQILADITGFTIERPEMREATSLGAAIAAASLSKVNGWDMRKPETLSIMKSVTPRVFHSTMEAEAQQKQFDAWQRAVARARHWHEDNR